MDEHKTFLNSKYILKANTHLKDRSQTMSKQMTIPEQLLWFNILKSRKLVGYKFIKQKIIGHYILDFYCSELLFAIEADGLSHENREEYDHERDDFLSKLGILTIHVYNSDILNNLEGVAEYLQQQVKFREESLSRINKSP